MMMDSLILLAIIAIVMVMAIIIIIIMPFINTSMATVLMLLLMMVGLLLLLLLLLLRVNGRFFIHDDEQFCDLKNVLKHPFVVSDVCAQRKIQVNEQKGKRKETVVVSVFIVDIYYCEQ
jgi:hypothetical protein